MEAKLSRSKSLENMVSTNSDVSCGVGLSPDCGCGIVVPYRELEDAEVELPPPQYYRRSRAEGPKEWAQSEKIPKTPPTLVLSLLKPHKILFASAEMCELLGYEEAELKGRSLNMIQGPKTNSSALTAAIKNTGLLSSGEVTTMFYASDGSERQITAACVPYLSDSGDLAGCTLQLTSDAVLEAEDIAVSLAKWMARAEQAAQCRSRADYNFRMGLTIQRSILHHANSPAASQPSRCESDIWL